MQKRRLFVIAFVVAAASLGIPSQVSAAPSIPRSLTAARTVTSQVRSGETKTFSVAMPWRANMIGVSFVDPSHSQQGIAIDARAHTAAGWSSWEELGADDNGTTGVETQHATKRLTTEAIWVGTADQVQVRVSVGEATQAIHDVRVHLINTLGDGQQENLFMRAVHALGHFLTSTPASTAAPAQAATTQPTIISRAQWGANTAYLNLPCPGVAPDLKMAFVHHTDTTNSYTKSQSAGIVRGIYAYHTNSRGYCDIAYNFLIDKYGQIFEGRLGGVTNNVIGAHTGGYNYGSVGVALLGNFSSVKPTYAMLTSLNRLLDWRLDVAHVPPTGIVTMTTGSGNDHHAAGSLVNFNRIAGHRDASYTSCPGSYVYADLAWIRSHVNNMGLPKIYLPAFSSQTVRWDGDTRDEAVRFTAGFSATVNWTLSLIPPTGAPRTITGSGRALKVYWGGQTASGAWMANGLYRWTLTAVDSAGHVATPASGSLYVVTSHPDGTVLSDSTGKYLVDGGSARPVDALAYASNYGTAPAVATGPNERARYTTGSPLGLRDGTLLVGPTGERYIWSGGALRHFTGTTFTGLGYAAAAAISVQQTTIDGLPAGPDISDITIHPSGTAVKSVDGKTFYVVDTGTLRPLSALARAATYRANEVVAATAGDLLLPAGPAFPVRDGAFVKATDGGAPWLVSDGTKHRFISAWFATYMGYPASTMLTATATDLNAIPTGARIG